MNQHAVAHLPGTLCRLVLPLGSELQPLILEYKETSGWTAWYPAYREILPITVLIQRNGPIVWVLYGARLLELDLFNLRPSGSVVELVRL